MKTSMFRLIRLLLAALALGLSGCETFYDESGLLRAAGQLDRQNYYRERGYSPAAAAEAARIDALGRGTPFDSMTPIIGVRTRPWP
jgi:hypothetical protein